MARRSSAVSVPERIVRFAISSVAQKIGFVAVRVGPAILARDLPHAFDVRVAHRFRSDVAASQEFAIVGYLRQAPLERFGLAGKGHSSIAPDHLESRIDELDPVEDRLQLRRLVDHVNRRAHLAAIVQQPRDLQLVSIPLAHAEIPERTVLASGHRVRQHHRERRNALAVPRGVGRLVVDRRVDRLDEGLEQFLEMIDEKPVAERDGRL